MAKYISKAFENRAEETGPLPRSRSLLQVLFHIADPGCSLPIRRHGLDAQLQNTYFVRVNTS